jgi:hypothetical protein
MGCFCNKGDNSEMIILDIQDMDNHKSNNEYIRKSSFISRKDKLSFMNKSNNEIEDGYENYNKTSYDKMDSMDTNKSNFKIYIYNLESLFIDQMLSEINEARANPLKYAEKIKLMIKNISDEDGNHYFSVDVHTKLILSRGREAFEECIEILKNQKPLPPLEFNKELKLPFPKDRPDVSTSREYITHALLEKSRELKGRYSINWFHYDNNVCDAEISCMMQIVDDNNSNGERRKHILDDTVRYVGINIGKVKNSIYCIYLVFGS